MLTEYMKHINKGKQQVEIDVYMWGSLSDKFKTDFKNKYRQHCSASTNHNVNYRKAIKHLARYQKVPDDMDFETMLAQDMLVLMYISLLPLYANGQREQSFYEAIDSMVGDEVAEFSHKYGSNFVQSRLLENYQLVVEGFCNPQISPHPGPSQFFLCTLFLYQFYRTPFP